MAAVNTVLTYDDYDLGENLGWGSGSMATPAEMVDAWMHSEGHRSNILYPRYREIGIGVTLGAPQELQPGETGAATYTTEFGRLTRAKG